MRIRPAFSRLAGAVLCSLLLSQSAAFARETVKIAFIGPLTGGISAHGIGGRNSAELAVQLRNADPSAKYTYELEAMDDECKPNVGVQVATKAASDKSIVAAIPFYCSAVAIAAVDVFHKFRMPMVVWAAVLPEITYGNDYQEVNRVSSTLINQNKVGSKFLVEQGYKTWVSIHDTTDYGKSMHKYFAENLPANGGKLLAEFGVGSDQQDFTAELTRIKELNPDVIYFGGLTPLAVRVITQMDKLGIKAQFQGTSGIFGDAFIKSLGAEAEGVFTTYDMPPVEQLPGGRFFLDAYTKAGYKEGFEAYGPYAFAATSLLLDVIEQVGPDRKKVIAALRDTHGKDSIVGKIEFDDHGQNITPMTTMYVVQDGKWVAWGESDYASGKRKLKNL